MAAKKKTKEKKIPKFNLNTASRILRYIIIFIVSLLIGLTIYMINLKYYLREPFPTIAGWGISVVTTGSMEPTINGGDLVFVQEQEEYEVGDCVVYVDQYHNPVVHRLIEIKDNGDVVTKGDANSAADKPFDISNIKGKVMHIIPEIGFMLNNYTKIIIMGLFVLLFIITIHKEVKIRKNDNKRLQDIQREIEEYKESINKTNSSDS